MYTYFHTARLFAFLLTESINCDTALVTVPKVTIESDPFDASPFVKCICFAASLYLFDGFLGGGGRWLAGIEGNSIKIKETETLSARFWRRQRYGISKLTEPTNHSSDVCGHGQR